jgi:hypothetical protein
MTLASTYLSNELAFKHLFLLNFVLYFPCKLCVTVICWHSEEVQLLTLITQAICF